MEPSGVCPSPKVGRRARLAEPFDQIVDKVRDGVCSAD